MTTYEHAMLGTCGVLSIGLQRRFGWPIVAIGAVAAVLPDWDGLTLALGSTLFSHLHRAVGHNLLVCVLLGGVVAALDYRYSLVCRIVRFVKSRLGRRLDLRAVASPIRRRFRPGELAVWVAVGVAASLSHLAGDLVFSGGDRLADWGLPLFWPFSDCQWVWPMVHWGDAWPTVIFVAGMFAMIAWPRRIERSARLTLVAEVGYIALRGFALWN